MKFRFCGDQDCPDWILTQMATLSRLSSVKAKLLAQQVARHLTGQEIDLEKCNSLLADSKLPESEVRSLLASIQFVLSSGSRFATDEDHLRAELQQIGLPREHAASLAKVHSDATDAIRHRLVDESLMFNKLEDVNCRLIDSKEPLVELKLHVKEVPTSDTKIISITADPAKLRTLLYELERIKSDTPKSAAGTRNPICNLPPVEGDNFCEAYMPSWTFNSTTETCDSFIYGGCGRTANLFRTKETCMEVCS